MIDLFKRLYDPADGQEDVARLHNFYSHVVSWLFKVNTETLIVVEKEHAKKMLDGQVCSNVTN